jgi:hypothetical protein
MMRIAIPNPIHASQPARPVTGCNLAPLDLVPCETTFGVSLIGASGTRFTSCCLRVMGRVVVIRMKLVGMSRG